ncbi:hypothetical protein DFH29DRAFT_188748 [Suillus ampliporus]|nr:hypothetical protein DFH29DRAFT_188748 [Suillus ampliporus]
MPNTTVSIVMVTLPGTMTTLYCSEGAFYERVAEGRRLKPGPVSTTSASSGSIILSFSFLLRWILLVANLLNAEVHGL